ncbi:MAG TPA: hypothetical protein DCP61_07695 [Treponema sp.]|nr:hypothetical protein [Treponema sp.]
MKTKRNIYSFLTASLALLVPSPGRFAYGILLLFMLNLLMLAGTLFKHLVKVLDLDELLPVLLAVFLMTVSVIFKQLLITLSPLAALTLGFIIYMPAVSSFLIGNLYSQNSDNIKENLAVNLKESILFSIFALAVFLFRDIFGYGTISLPAASGLVEISLIKVREGGFYPGIFWATIPGALVIIALSLAIYVHVISKFNQVKEQEESNANA